MIPLEADEVKLFTIPNIVTLFNLVSGMLAIIFISRNILISIGLIMLAIFFDALDGLIARKLKATSLIGKELDSLADVVSFGVAPAFLLAYNYSSIYFLLSTIVAIEYVCLGALRLAKFNIVGKKEYFEGTPITSQAAFVSSALIIFHKYLPLLLTALFSPLMISNFRYPNLKTRKGSRIMLILILGSAILWILLLILLRIHDVITILGLYAFLTTLTYFILGPFLFSNL